MKKLIIVFQLALIFMCGSISVNTYATIEAETNNTPSRIINLVYDDSGSMIKSDGVQYVDTWCQARYAMEVFAAMLGNKDELNIFYMSDYYKSSSATPRLNLKGSNNSSVTKSNVNKIHDTITEALGTPFVAVEKAYEDLKVSTCDEKWLVVLTDGEFNGVSSDQVYNKFIQYTAEKDIKVLMLGMGPDAAVINSSEENNIFFYKAENTTDILGKLTELCNRIFQNNVLPVNEDNTISFNVPMKELIVFAQGEEVSIKSLTSTDGNIIKPVSNVKVQYSDTATTSVNNYPQNVWIIANNLKGNVASFGDHFEPGTYKIDVNGASDIQVYYKPDVAIAAYLYDGEIEVTKEEFLPSGNYRLEFGFINPKNGELIEDTSLLGDIEYEYSIVNLNFNGEEKEVETNSDGTIGIEEGQLKIDVSAKFLDYNKVDANLSYDVFTVHDLIFTFEKTPTYILKIDGIENKNEPIVLDVKINEDDQAKSLTQEQWNLMGDLIVTHSYVLGDIKVEKTDQIGKYNLYISEYKDIFQTSTGDVEIEVSGGYIQNLSTANGSAKCVYQIENHISLLDRLIDFWNKHKKLIIGVSICLFIIIAYAVKKRLPKNISKQIKYKKENKLVFGAKEIESNGSYHKDLLSVILPFIPETGSITFAPGTTARLKALGGGLVQITNAEILANSKNKTINIAGKKVPTDKNGQKNFKTGINSIPWTMENDQYKYRCVVTATKKYRRKK